MMKSSELLGNVMKSHSVAVNSIEYTVMVLNAQYCYHGCCFALDWTGRATTLHELLIKFRAFATRRQQWEKSA